MIDLNKFTEAREEILPIVDGWGQVNQRKIYLSKAEDGWYQVRVGFIPKIIRKATPLEAWKVMGSQKTLRVYSLGLEGVPANFDNLLKQGLGETIPVYFLNLPLYEVARVVRWEDKRFYFYEPDVKFQRSLLKEIQTAFNAEQGIENIKGRTPELAYYFLLTSLERESFRAADRLLALKLSEAERAKRIKEFESTFSGRLKVTIEKAGGTLVKFMKANKDTYMIHWKVKGSDQLVKSTIKDNMQILNLGYCASNHDKEHTMASAIQLAKMYGDLYITRE